MQDIYCSIQKDSSSCASPKTFFFLSFVTILSYVKKMWLKYDAGEKKCFKRKVLTYVKECSWLK